jgi:hypothetical protein
MDFRKKINLLERNIVTEESAIRAQKVLALAVVIASLLAAVLVHILAGPTISENYKWMLSLAGTGISGTAGFPLKDLYGKRNKIYALTYLRDEYETLQNSPMTADPLQVEELEKRFWSFFEKNV